MKTSPENGGSRRFKAPAPAALSFLILALGLAFLGLCLRVTAGLPIFYPGIGVGLFACLGYAALGACLCALAGGKGLSKWLCFAFLELFTLWYLAAFFMDDSYQVFMELSIVFSVAGDAAENFGGNVLNVFTKGLPLILLYHIPAALFLIFARKLPFGGQGRLKSGLALFCAAFIFTFGGSLLARSMPALREQYENEYTYDSAVRNFGLLSALNQSLRRAAAPGEVQAPDFVTLPQETEAPPAAETPRVYGKNQMDIDFAATNPGGNSIYSALNEYAESLSPSSQNQYTGLFEGKNLILITAEAFSKELIDPERTPTLYRLASKGIVFEDFYQPAWGGSTSTGEYSWLTGLAPTHSMAMMNSINSNMYFTMGNQLQRLGYFSVAYHNGTTTYYNRDLTHPNLGYSQFIAIGNGMEQGISGGFPASDLEMMDFTLPQYVDKQPFSVYYMTISGHASYAFRDDVNDMALKNQAITEDMEGSDAVKAYYACNQELEYALESLVSGLEEAGIADDTVIALVSDHYPYGLMPSAAWGLNENHLEELYGFEIETSRDRDHNAAIIWCGSLEELEEPIVVSEPVSSLDILPTLSNLFGLEYDSRLLAGRDVFSDQEPLVFWNDYSWLTDKGYYDSHTRTFTPAPGEDPDEVYVEQMKNTVKNKLTFSQNVAGFNYYGFLFGKDEVK